MESEVAQLLSHVQLFVTPWTLAYHAPPSMGFPRQENWSGVPLPSPNQPCSPSLIHEPAPAREGRNNRDSAILGPGASDLASAPRGQDSLALSSVFLHILLTLGSKQNLIPRV